AAATLCASETSGGGAPERASGGVPSGAGHDRDPGPRGQQEAWRDRDARSAGELHDVERPELSLGLRTLLPLKCCTDLERGCEAPPRPSAELPFLPRPRAAPAPLLPMIAADRPGTPTPPPPTIVPDRPGTPALPSPSPPLLCMPHPAQDLCSFALELWLPWLAAN
ncbi:uncharacterized protein, partial [Dipodomys merriami]|uniref:uncharacterized protein n=1 Tax=Dipodomys merriami TaxID=94247 RepID=UPI003855A97A